MGRRERALGLDRLGPPARAYALQDAGTGQRTLATLLFTDFVESTVRARQLGDAQWRDLLGRHNELVRSQLDRYRGREIDTTGDGFLAVFDSPLRAVAAAWAIVAGVRSLGIEVRAGVHTGEVEIEPGNVRGLTVHIAARVMSLAGPREVLVSWTTRDLVTDSAFGFLERGTHELRGLRGPRAIFALAPVEERR